MGVALAALRLGAAGRAKTDEKPEYAVGVSGPRESRRPGRSRRAALRGCTPMTKEPRLEAQAMLAKAIVIGDKAVKAPKLIDEIIG